jgi:eukaryotic-like serine/threonine-protein kinase
VSTTPERWTHIESVFLRALELARGERSSFLDEACADDHELRREVESLLREHEAEPDFLEEAAGWLGVEGVEAPGPPPERIGPYQVLGVLGRGGMGQVYLVERREPGFRHRAALKVVRRGMDTEDLLERFRRERQILASLDHPNIARLLDVGATDEGRPYFVMEHVDGRPVLEYCEEKGLDLRARLEIFRVVCTAVHHAHRNLVVHRDLKPGNMVVTDEGVPKLLDFGIAKMLDPLAAPRANDDTAIGVRILTPEYAAPEQLQGGPITTACDIYVLGLVLHELLTGRHAEGDPPTGASPLPSDLRTVIGKALEREPEDRYPSVLALSDDLERYLRGRPILARPPTLRYRVRKFVGRNRAGVTAATIAGVALTVSVTTALHQSYRVQAESERAVRERDKAMAVRAFLLEMFGTTGPDQAAGDTVTARQLLDRRLASLPAYEHDPELRAEMLTVLAEGYEKLGLLGDAEPLAREGLALRRGLAGDHRADVVESLTILGWTQHRRRELDEAEALLREAVETGRTLATEEGDIRLARALNDLGVVREARRDLDEAASLYHESLAIRRRLGEQPLGAAVTASNLSVVLYRQGDLDAAVAMADSSLALFRDLLGPDHPRSLLVKGNLAAMQTVRGDHAGAAWQHRDILERRRRLLGPTHPLVAYSMTMLANALWAGQVDVSEAEGLLLEALEIQESSPDVSDDQVAAVLQVLGDIEVNSRRPARALERYRRARDLIHGIYGDRHERMVILTSRMAVALERAGDVPDAARHHDEALRRATTLGIADTPQVLTLRVDRLEFLARAGHTTDALAELEALAAVAGGDVGLEARITRVRQGLTASAVEPG